MQLASNTLMYMLACTVYILYIVYVHMHVSDNDHISWESVHTKRMDRQRCG